MQEFVFDFPLQRKIFFFAAMGKTDGDTLQCSRVVGLFCMPDAIYDRKIPPYLHIIRPFFVFEKAGA